LLSFLIQHADGEGNVDKMLLAKAHILVAKWMKATGHTHHEVVAEHYEQSIKLCPSYVKLLRGREGEKRSREGEYRNGNGGWDGKVTYF
jgi:hypothetical protein